jgi:hypothetical protein
MALWASYHPSQVSQEAFLTRCQVLLDAGISFSVGAVGAPEALPRIQALRAALDPRIYLWINALKNAQHRISPETNQAFEDIDPLYHFTIRPQPSLGRACRTGEQVFSVDGEGTLRRCNFVPEILGNLYDPDCLEAAIQSRPCTLSDCRCHIGYLHMPHLGLGEIFGEGVLERVLSHEKRRAVSERKMSPPPASVTPQANKNPAEADLMTFGKPRT